MRLYNLFVYCWFISLWLLDCSNKAAVENDTETESGTGNGGMRTSMVTRTGWLTDHRRMTLYIPTRWLLTRISIPAAPLILMT